MSRALLLSILALGLVAATPSVSVVDGDTFVLGSDRIRLWGVDAPEGHQVCQDRGGRAFRCGDVARVHLKALIGTRSVGCRSRARDAYGRTVAQCRAGSVDLGEAMVRAGWAVELPQFSHGAYTSAEAQARAARRGLWAGRFETPADWRAEVRARQAPPARSSGACEIKGNINAKGRKIFHLPGQQDYATTVINLAQGERWFCTAAEATAAGWTPAAR